MRDMGGKAVCDASGCGVNLRNLGQQPLGAVPFGHSEHRQRFALTLLLLLAASTLMTSKCSKLISPAASWHSCPLVVLLLAVQPLVSYLENKAFRLGGDCVCVSINMFRGTCVCLCTICVYVYVGCWLLKAVTYFSAFSFYLPSLSLFYCVILIFTTSFRLSSMCLAGVSVLLCLASSSLEIYVVVTDKLHLWIILVLSWPLIKILVSCTFVGL